MSTWSCVVLVVVRVLAVVVENGATLLLGTAGAKAMVGMTQSDATITPPRSRAAVRVGDLFIIIVIKPVFLC